MRYADHKKTLDKYGGTKETISIWAPSYTPHIPKIARNSNSLLPETTLSKILGQPQILKFKISVVFHSNCYKWQITSGWTSYQKISYFRGNVVKNHTLRGKNRGSTLRDRRHSIPRYWILWKLDNITTQQYLKKKDKSLWSSYWCLIRTHHTITAIL